MTVLTISKVALIVLRIDLETLCNQVVYTSIRLVKITSHKNTQSRREQGVKAFIYSSHIVFISATRTQFNDKLCKRWGGGFGYQIESPSVGTGEEDEENRKQEEKSSSVTKSPSTRRARHIANVN
jgi:hypothetical protein